MNDALTLGPLVCVVRTCSHHREQQSGIEPIGCVEEVIYCDSQNADILEKRYFLMPPKDCAELQRLAQHSRFQSWLEAGWSRDTMEMLQALLARTSLSD
eukprot:4653467-Amphidinium_carterae.2